MPVHRPTLQVTPRALLISAGGIARSVHPHARSLRGCGPVSGSLNPSHEPSVRHHGLTKNTQYALGSTKPDELTITLFGRETHV